MVAILNNLEYDHADIFPDIAAIQRQFHHLVRTVPQRGRLIVNGEEMCIRDSPECAPGRGWPRQTPWRCR